MEPIACFFRENSSSLHASKNNNNVLEKKRKQWRVNNHSRKASRWDKPTRLKFQPGYYRGGRSADNLINTSYKIPQFEKYEHRPVGSDDMDDDDKDMLFLRKLKKMRSDVPSARIYNTNKFEKCKLYTQVPKVSLKCWINLLSNGTVSYH